MVPQVWSAIPVPWLCPSRAMKFALTIPVAVAVTIAPVPQIEYGSSVMLLLFRLWWGHPTSKHAVVKPINAARYAYSGNAYRR